MTPDQPTATATPRTAEQARVDAHIHLQNERIPRIAPEQALINWATFARTLASELAAAKSEVARLKAEIQYGTETGEPCAEITSLRAELQQIADTLPKRGHDTIGAAKDMMEDLAEHRARVAELEADKARLDWLEATRGRAGYSSNTYIGEGFFAHEHAQGDKYFAATTLRAAIDAAKGAK